MWIFKSMQHNERWVFAIFATVYSFFIHISIEIKSKILTSLRLYYNAVSSHFFYAIIKSLTGNIYRNECNMKIVKCVNIIQQINKTSLKFWSTKKQWHQTQCLGTQFNDCWWICNHRNKFSFKPSLFFII